MSRSENHDLTPDVPKASDQSDQMGSASLSPARSSAAGSFASGNANLFRDFNISLPSPKHIPLLKWPERRKRSSLSRGDGATRSESGNLFELFKKDSDNE